jgi:hypothetical protein
MPITGQELLDQFLQSYTSGRDTGVDMLQGVADLYGPNYLKGAENRALASMEQSMVGRGISNFTVPVSASIGLRQSFEDERLRGRAGAMTNIADFISRFYPSPGTLAHLATGGFGGGSVTGPAGSTTISGPGGTQTPGTVNRVYGRTFGASSFQGSGLLYPNQGTAGRLGAGSGGGSGIYSPGALPTYGSSYGGGGTSNISPLQPSGSSALQPSGGAVSPGYNLISNQDWLDIQAQADALRGGAASALNPTVSSPGVTATTTSTKPTVDTSGWTEAEKVAWATYVPGVSGYNVLKLKQQQGLA